MLPVFALAATALLLPAVVAAPTPTEATAITVARGPRHTLTGRPTMHVLPLSALDNVWNDPAASAAPSNKSGPAHVARSMMHDADFAARHLTSEGFLDSADQIRERTFSPQTATLLKRDPVSISEDEAVLAKRRLQIRAVVPRLDGERCDDQLAVLLWGRGHDGLSLSVLTTFGNPTDDSRATLVVQGSSQSCAVYGVGAGLDQVVLRNVQINGNRPALGRLSDGIALIEMGGDATGQQIISVRSYEPRGWSALHTIEGNNLDCSGMMVTGNQIGPSGNGPSPSDQFPPDNAWADGMSIACKNSQITNNIVTDATDGGIVIFGAPGSNIQGNTIKAVSRQLMGGINMVDWNPFRGSFEGTIVQGNNIIASSQFIKVGIAVGIAVGGMVWGSDNRTAARTFGGSILNNAIIAGASGYFEYGIAVAGHERATVLGNAGDQGAWGGQDTQYCFPNQYPLPSPRPGVIDPYTTPGTTIQDGFYNLLPIVFAICRGPGPIQYRGY